MENLPKSAETPTFSACISTEQQVSSLALPENDKVYTVGKESRTHGGFEATLPLSPPLTPVLPEMVYEHAGDLEQLEIEQEFRFYEFLEELHKLTLSMGIRVSCSPASASKYLLRYLEEGVDKPKSLPTRFRDATFKMSLGEPSHTISLNIFSWETPVPCEAISADGSKGSVRVGESVYVYSVSLETSTEARVDRCEMSSSSLSNLAQNLWDPDFTRSAYETLPPGSPSVAALMYQEPLLGPIAVFDHPIACLKDAAKLLNATFVDSFVETTSILRGVTDKISREASSALSPLASLAIRFVSEREPTLAREIELIAYRNLSHSETADALNLAGIVDKVHSVGIYFSSTYPSNCPTDCLARILLGSSENLYSSAHQLEMFVTVGEQVLSRAISGIPHGINFTIRGGRDQSDSLSISSAELYRPSCFPAAPTHYLTYVLSHHQHVATEVRRTLPLTSLHDFALTLEHLRELSVRTAPLFITSLSLLAENLGV